MAVSHWEYTLDRAATGTSSTTASITYNINKDGKNEQESKPEYNLHKNFITGHICAIFNNPQFLSIITSHRVCISVDSEIVLSFVDFKNDIYISGSNKGLNFGRSIRVVRMDFINWNIKDGGFHISSSSA